MRTTTILARLALPVTLVVLAACSSEEPPAPDDALDRVRERAMDQNADGAVDPSESQTRNMPEADPETPAQNAGGATVIGDSVVKIGGLVMTAPTRWVAGTPTSTMRAAQYSVGDSGEFVIFSGIRGGVDANINRWVGQVQGATPVRDTITRDGITIHTVEMTGTYQGMTMAGNTPAQSGTVFYGAVIEGASTPLQLRLTINAEEADSYDADWDALLASIVRAG